jgi:hypothetical protein
MTAPDPFAEATKKLLPNGGRPYMVCWNAIFEIEQIEELPLIVCLPTHHDQPPLLNESSERESCCAENHEPFFDNIDPKRNWPEGQYCHRGLTAVTSIVDPQLPEHSHPTNAHPINNGGKGTE